ncbi:MAG: DNA-formamidopyrimidine glycosylase [Clostridiaceae bacterium]|nr:DNA-formamidopyrimidine glycosylase [Clostridiaceae bacterium]
MPELPEVETIRRSLIKKIDKMVISEIIVCHPDVLLNYGDFDLKNWQIINIKRRGKYLLFDLKSTEDNSNKMLMMIHLRMTGKLLLEEKGTSPAKHTHVRFLLEDGSFLDFNDVRRFGRVKLFKPGHEIEDKGFRTLGPEPLGDDFTLEYFLKESKRRPRSTIKSFILNQQVIAGIGNIYADESLFRAKIKPDNLVGEISKDKLTSLHQAIREIIEEAIGHRGTSFRDYVDGLGNKGFFQLKLAVYQKEDEPCQICETKIEKIKVAGRSTHYCPNCQK